MINIIIFLISILLETLIYFYIPINVGNFSPFIPMFTIVAIIIVLPFFNSDNHRYLWYCGVFGFIYDILFTNTLFLNLILFILIGFTTIIMDNFLSNNLISMIVKMLINFIIYDFITYFVLLLIGYINYGITAVFFKFINSILLNLIYIVILYYVTNFIAYKFKLKKTI